VQLLWQTLAIKKSFTWLGETSNAAVKMAMWPSGAEANRSQVAVRGITALPLMDESRGLPEVCDF